MAENFLQLNKEKSKILFIHSLSVTADFCMVAGRLELIPINIWWVGASYTVAISLLHYSTDISTHILNAHTNTYGQFRITSYSACLWTVEGSGSTRREPTQTRGEHANSTQKGPTPAGYIGTSLRSQGSKLLHIGNFLWNVIQHFCTKGMEEISSWQHTWSNTSRIWHAFLFSPAFLQMHASYFLPCAFVCICVCFGIFVCEKGFFVLFC